MSAIRSVQKNPGQLFAKRAARTLVCVVALLCGLGGPWMSTARGAGESQLPLLSYTNWWRYFTNGTELGTAWRGTNFEERAWPVGRGLLGVESTPSRYTDAPFNTFFGSPTVTNVYFRSHFTFPTNPLHVVNLILSNYIDDGAVIYLNGTEVARFRVPVGQSASTLASDQPATEGQHDVAIVDTASSLLREGDNLLAAEVHQYNIQSADIVWGAAVTAVLATPISIVTQPVSQTILAGAPLTLSVSAAGTAPMYQWFKDGVPINGATGATYAVSSTAYTNAGLYHARVSNPVNTVTSDDARIVIVPDISGPRLVSAYVLESSSYPNTNAIFIELSERCSAGSSLNTNNWRITLVGTTNSVPLLDVVFNGDSLFRVRVATNNWHLGGMSNYVLTVSGIRDRTGNVIAPESQVAIAWPLHLTLIEANALWSYHTAAFFEPDIFDQGWQRCDYVESPWWAQGYSPLCGGPAFAAPCFGPYQTEIGYQPQPSLFRCPFVWPADPSLYWPSNSPAQLTIAGAFDDGVVFYLNGVEILRNNLPPPPLLLAADTKAIAGVANAACTTVLVSATNLVSGTNWLTAAVFQANDASEADTVFALRLIAAPYRPPPSPESPPPVLSAAFLGNNGVRLSWNGGGFALESTTNLPPSTNSPWLEVTNMSNPFFQTNAEPSRFFRLRK